MIGVPEFAAEPRIPGPESVAVNDSVAARAALLARVTLIVAAATVSAATAACERVDVTVASAVADAVSPALRIDVAVAATLSSAGAAVTVIVRSLAVAFRVQTPETAGVTRTTSVPATVGASKKTWNLAEAFTGGVPVGTTNTFVFAATPDVEPIAMLAPSVV